MLPGYSHLPSQLQETLFLFDLGDKRFSEVSELYQAIVDTERAADRHAYYDKIGFGENGCVVFRIDSYFPENVSIHRTRFPGISELQQVELIDLERELSYIIEINAGKIKQYRQEDISSGELVAKRKFGRLDR